MQASWTSHLLGPSSAKSYSFTPPFSPPLLLRKSKRIVPFHLAFKIRGATNALLRLLSSPDFKSTEYGTLTVLTHSSGNHAQALAYAARALNIHCEVIMPSNASLPKAAAVRAYGAHITYCEPTLSAREETAEAKIRELKEQGRRPELIPPYDDVQIIAGQGTATLEMIEQAKERGEGLDIIIAPVGGGGLLSGTAVAAKGLDPGIVVVGAEPEAANDARMSFESKQWIPVKDPRTVADGLKTSLGHTNFQLILKYVDAIWTVSEVQIM
jgi:threonine dehydratase